MMSIGKKSKNRSIVDKPVFKNKSAKVLVKERFVLLDPTKSMILKLPPVKEASGRFLFKMVSSSGIVTLDGYKYEKIDGAANFKLKFKNEFVELLPDGVGWHIVNYFKGAIL